jgi:hypothetical protein
LPSACIAQKAAALPFEFSPEIVQNARFEMQTLYSIENPAVANDAPGQDQVGRGARGWSDYYKN